MSFREFKPMAAATRTAHPKTNTEEGNPNYKGDPYAKDNKDAKISEAMNCKTYVNNLPQDIEPWQLLAAIRNCGKVKACHVNGPNEWDPLTSDATVLFFNRESALAFVRQNGVFRIPGYPAVLPRIRWNRQKVAPEADAGKSRVLRITGNRQFVNYESLHKYFSKKVDFQVEKVVTVWTGPGMQKMDWYFSGWYPQAKAVKMALELEYPNILGNLIGVRVETRPDPCAGS